MVIGPESTGKSTLSQQLAAALAAPWVPEYAREYLQSRQNCYTYADLARIARGQLRLEDEISKQAERFLICDTDLYVIKVWSEHKYQTADPFILESIATRHYDAYILCDIDMPWVDDPQREYPDPEMRRYFFHWYKDIVVHSGRPFLIASGNASQRLQQVLNSFLFRQGEKGNM